MKKTIREALARREQYLAEKQTNEREQDAIARRMRDSPGIRKLAEPMPWIWEPRSPMGSALGARRVR